MSLAEENVFISLSGLVEDYLVDKVYKDGVFYQYGVFLPLDGEEVVKVTRDELYDQFGVVFEREVTKADTFGSIHTIMTKTITNALDKLEKDGIALGHTDTSLADILRVVTQSCSSRNENELIAEVIDRNVALLLVGYLPKDDGMVGSLDVLSLVQIMEGAMS